MAVRIAQAARKGMNMPRYQAQSPGPLREQEGLLDMAKPYVADVAMKKAEEKAKLEAEKKKLEEEEAARLAAHPEKKCDNCGAPLPKKPFYALQFAYCKTECIREHKRKLQLARFG